MKKFLTVSLTILMLLMSLFVLTSCNKDDGVDGEEMLYTEDTTLGTGSTTFTLIVEHMDGTKINFTVSTNKTILSDALTEVGILQGREDIYGMYIEKVNGITQSWDIDKSYWAIYEGDSYASSGIDGITIKPGATYKLVASK